MKKALSGGAGLSMEEGVGAGVVNGKRKHSTEAFARETGNNYVDLFQRPLINILFVHYQPRLFDFSIFSCLEMWKIWRKVRQTSTVTFFSGYYAIISRQSWSQAN